MKSSGAVAQFRLEAFPLVSLSHIIEEDRLSEVEPADKLPSCRKDLNMEGQVSDVHVPLVWSNFFG